MKKSCIAFALWLAWTCAGAQSLAPQEFYFDEDASTTRPIAVVTGLEGDALVNQLAATVQRRPEDIESRAQLAHVAMQNQRIELGNELYAAALRNARSNKRLSRTVAWNYGWDLYRAGQPQQALEQWQPLLGGWPSAPSWQPPTLALVLWKLGRRADAVAWYAAAARTEPARWGDPGNFPALLPDWREDERATLAEVFAAWQAAPPSWP